VGERDKSSLESRRFLKNPGHLLPFQVAPASSPSTYGTHKHTYLPTQLFLAQQFSSDPEWPRPHFSRTSGDELDEASAEGRQGSSESFSKTASGPTDVTSGGSTGTTAEPAALSLVWVEISGAYHVFDAQSFSLRCCRALMKRMVSFLCP
jgi:hypothetical protein